jgi:hypothetical protein
MAGDRGLIFVIIGLIGLSAFAILNHGRIGPRSPVHATAVVAGRVPLGPENAKGSTPGDEIVSGRVEKSGPAPPLD